ncbi:phage tail tape measure protein [Pseudomonas cremoricolorata]|uniref:Tail protein n=1 Tax=Pseudomonas cremoricolorata TaxID=157783 RepID=A0A089WVI1_9PSED|nr:phage tail tape measure protein [Pseudomonas cremoricolorata]AIR90587.1 tail protein [Pseudomonas cremoricolorata]
MADKFQLKALITGVDKLSPTLQGARKNIAAFRKNLESTGLGKIGFRDIVTGGAIAAPFIAGAKAAIDLESQMADVRKVVDFDTPEQFKQMGDDIVRLTDTLPMAATDIAKIVAAGGQSGIARKELLGFAESAVKMGVAFDQTADESGSMMAKWRTAFRMTQGGVEELADKINYLGNTGPATNKQISDIVTRIGPLGEIAGLASGQIAALGATMAGVGIEQEVAATGIKNFMLAMTKGSAATKAQATAFKSLRLDSKQVAKDMQKDAQGTVLNILERIGRVDKDKQAGVLSTLFGTESISAIAPLLTNLELLKSNLKKVGDSSLYAGSMQKEFAARAATTENNLGLLKNGVMSNAIALGNALLPGINAVVDQIRPWLTQVSKMISENPKLVQGIAAAGIAFTALRGAVFAAGVAARIMGLAFAATPVGLIAVGIAAAAGLIIANWEKVGPFFTALWDLIKAYTKPFMEFMGKLFDWSPMGRIIKNWQPITAYFKGLWEKVKPYVMPLFKLFGYEEGKGLTENVQRMAQEQRARNAGDRRGTGELLAFDAGAVAKIRLDENSRAFGIDNRALLQAPGQLPAPGSLLRQSTATNKTQLDGELRVRFENPPAGMRVESTRTSQPGVTVKAKVGYRTVGNES